MGTFTIEATKDATMVQQGNLWSGFDRHMPVGVDTSNKVYRSVVYFPIALSNIITVTSATLKLVGSNMGASHINSNGSRAVFARRMTADWGEGADNGEGVFAVDPTWGWNNRFDKYDTSTQTSISISGALVDLTVYSFDVTNIVRQWVAGSPNYGLILNAQTEVAGNRGVEFYSRNRGSGYRPILEIVYTGNEAPSAPINLNPTADALVNSLTPNLSGVQADANPNDGISGYTIRLYADDGTTLIWDSGTVAGRCVTVNGVLDCTGTFSETYSGPALTGNTFYKWKARTKDEGGLFGPFSALQRFKTNTPPNPPIVAITESPVTDLKTLTPQLNITHSDNDPADIKMYGYRVIVEKSDGTAVWDSGDIDTSGAPVTVKTFTYSGPALSYRNNYRWRARTRDSNLVWGNYSANQLFATHYTAPPSSLNPSASEEISGLVPNFTGVRSDVNDTITSYQIILYESAGGSQIWDSGSLSTGIVGGASFAKVYTGTALSYGTTYQWKASVTSTIGGTSDYSLLQVFKTPVDAATPVLNLPTPNNSPTNLNVTSLTPTLTGTRTSSAFTDYQIELYPASSTSVNLGTPIWQSGTLTQASATSFSKVYNGPALAWNTTYKWRVRVGAPSFLTWTGLASFTTDSALTPTLTAPADNNWETTLTPTLTGSTSGGETATQYQILMYEEDGVTLKWDSGLISQTASTTFSKVYNGPALQGGRDYHWQARIVKSTGPTSAYSVSRSFHTNAIPSVPTQLAPVPGQVYNNMLTPTFEAYFNDDDKSQRGDYPTEWHIEIRNNTTDVLVQEKVLSSDLNTGLNTYVWGTATGGADTGLAYNVDYKWRTWYVDSKAGVGAASSYQIFHNSTPPTVSIVTPSNGSNINTTRPTVVWSFTGSNSKTQIKYRVRINRQSNDVVVFDSGVVVSTLNTFTIPTGYLQKNGEMYGIWLNTYDTDNLMSATAISVVQLELNAPPRIEGLSVTIYEDQSRVGLDWDASSLGQNFVTYVVYRRRLGETEWGMIGAVKPESRVTFNDYYAGQQQGYEYRVTVVKLIGGEPDLESPDSDIASGRLESDVWYVIGADRTHVFELPVSDETHTRPVQQEAFEPIGLNRKAVVRGFVLGHEGTLDVVWQPEEKADADENMTYLIYQAGPHILKNPFGDVYEVTFGTQDGQYQTGGVLTTSLVWIETSQKTNNPLLTPDEFLATIGAE